MNQNDRENRIGNNTGRLLLILVAVASCFAIWMIKRVLAYIILSAVIALVCRPIMNLLCKIPTGKIKVPKWIYAIITELLILFLVSFVIMKIIPIVYSIADKVIFTLQNLSVEQQMESVSIPIQKFNEKLIHAFPFVGKDFKIEDSLIKYINDIFSISSVSSILGSVAYFFANTVIGIFSVLFIAFFFINDRTLFKRITAAFIPDKYEQKAMSAIDRIEDLLSGYFGGLLVETIGVGLINFAGLYLIAGADVYTSAGIAFITGILNIIPYIGPLIGTIIGIIAVSIMKIDTIMATGGIKDITTYMFILLCIFSTTQILDNFLFQPVIYSKSIKANALEIFIVLLIAGNIGGMATMLIAIPLYTALRVMAGEFFSHIKPIRIITSKNK